MLPKLTLILLAFGLTQGFTIRDNEVLLSAGSWWNPPDSAQLIENNGYPVEVHDIETEDGYILKTFRIPYGKKNSTKKNRPPIIVQHGVLCTSDCWVVPIPSKGLGYVLADAGYDVWIPNNRGVTYSQRHRTLSPKDPKFWNYSVHELGYYDLPAIIDYVLDKTSHSKTSFVGHSQGTTQFFVMASQRPEYNNKIKVMAGLGPVAYLDHTRGLVKFLSHFSRFLAWVAKIFGINKMLQRSTILGITSHILCGPHSLLKPICNDIFFLIVGFDSPQMNGTIGEQVADYCPSGASIKQLNHFAQLTSNGGKFTLFDYGKDTNLQKYNTPKPPEYDLTKISAPVALYHGNNDFIATPPEVVRLGKILPNLIKRVLVDDPQFNHLDFMWAIDVNKLLYNDFLATIKRFL